jgi:probable RNA-binding protein EIF1AD
MSRVTKLKKIKREIEADDLSLPTEKQQIVRVISSKGQSSHHRQLRSRNSINSLSGNNLHEVETETESKFLVSMPNKFRKNVWIKRGNYVLVEEIDEGDKVKAEIVRILTDEHIKEFEKHNQWPKKFTKKRELSELHENQNRRRDFPESEEESSSESD